MTAPRDAGEVVRYDYTPHPAQARAHAVGQIEHAAGLAAWAVDVEHDGRYRRIGDGGIKLRGDVLIAGQAGRGFQPDGAPHQGAVDRQDGDACIRGRRAARGGRRDHRAAVRQPDARPQYGEDHFEFRAMNQQRRAKDARRHMR